MMKKIINISFFILFFVLILTKVTLATEIDKSNNIKETQIEKGYYIIKSALNENKVLDIDGVSKENEANIQLYTKNKGTNQIFEISSDNNGNYTIKSVFSGKVLDIAWASKNPEANVQLYDYQNVDWQKWKIDKTDDGYYEIKSVWSGLLLDIPNNKTKDGTNVQVYTSNNGKNQKFIIEKIELLKGTQDLEDGFYQISTAIDSNKVIDILGGEEKSKTLAGIWQKNGGANQRFKLIYAGNGYYNLVAVHSGLHLEAAGTRMRQYTSENSIVQKWILKETGEEGYYNIISASNGLYLTVSNGDELQTYEKNATKAQMFKLEKKASLRENRVLKDGYYIIKSSLDKNKVIDINNESIKSEANVQLWTRKGRNNQKFKVTYDEKVGNYTITSVKSKKTLDVAFAGKNNESNIQQYTLTNSDWQKWIIEMNTDETYSISSVCNGLYMDIPNSKTLDGTNIQTYEKNGGKNQKFIFEEISAVEGEKTLKDGYYKIQTNLNKAKVLDVGNFSKNDHINISLWETNNGYNQRFKITYKENEYYTIKAVHSDKVMDLSADGNNIEQNSSTNAEEQEWVIKSDGSGNYNIISAHNGLYLSIEDENAVNGSNVLVDKRNDSVSQKFSFKNVEVEVGKQTISNGVYQIVTHLDNNKVLDITGDDRNAGANLEIWKNNYQGNQNFEITYQGNGYYKIVGYNSKKALGVEEAGSGSTVNVKQYDNIDNLKQEWIIKEAGNGYYNIVSRCNGLYLDVDNQSSNDGTNVQVYTKLNNSGQKFKFIKSKMEINLETGTYGFSGLKIKGDSRGSDLRYYKIGDGNNVYFATFAVHGFEDLWDYDGQELTKIAESFKNKLIEMKDYEINSKWTIYICPSVNPDGEYHGYTNNGPGRTSLYSEAPSHKGIDINRCWSTGFKEDSTNRNYTGTQPFQAYEAKALREFLLARRATNGQTVLVDLHGWLNETIGDDEIGSYYRSTYGINKHIPTYGQGYLVNWARANLGYNGKIARSCLVELPEYNSDSTKYIEATLNMLRNIK